MRSVRFIVVLCFIVLASAASFAAEVPVVVAVDTSRSLKPSDLASISDSLNAALRELSAATPLGLIGFNDEATWLAPIGSDAGEVVSALQAATPEGQFTALHDALFLAARELEGGGVILVVTDGRDENSATTVDDVARRCESQQVRILTAGVGRRLDDRALRRFAMLSGGEYLGALASTRPGAVAGALRRARASVAAELTKESAAADRPSAARRVDQAGAATRPVSATEKASSFKLWWVPVGALAAIFFVVLLWFASRPRRARKVRGCPSCGAELEAWESSCSACELAELEESTASQPVAKPSQPEEPDLDPAVFDKVPLPEGLDQTMVLDEQPVLVLKQRGKPPRTYSLPRMQTFAVGRAPGVNTLVLDDPTVSAQHFKVVPKDEDFYVVDLGTTNGTNVNHERVKVKKLAAGDTIGVGTLELEFRKKIRRLG